MAESPEPLPAVVQHYKIFLQPDGQKVIENLFTRYNYPGDTFIADKDGHYDPISAAKRDGAHGVIRHILSQINQIQTHGTPKKKPTASYG